MVKKCSRCSTEKPLGCFSKDKATKDGLYRWCKECQKNYRHQRYSQHKDEENQKSREWRQENKEYLTEWRKNSPIRVKRYTRVSLSKHKETNKERLTAWRKKNPEHIREYNKKWSQNNHARLREAANRYRKEKYRNDVQFRLAYSLRSRLRIALKNNTKDRKTLDYLGCSLQNLKQSLERKFQPEMSWENYGKGGWHIDHIVPLSSFDLSKKDEIRKDCHYTNLQPLWEKDNLRKGKRILDNELIGNL